MTRPTKTIEFRSGTIAYHEAGEGPALLMLHGSGPGVTAWLNFGNNLPTFAEHFRCIAPDLPGYGDSSGIEGDPFAGTIEAVIHIMDVLGIATAHIIGNSFGGLIAARLAAAFPERINRLVVIGGIGVPVFNPFPYEGITRLADFVAEPSRENIVKWLSSMVYDQSMVTEDLIAQRMATTGDPKVIETNKKIYSRESLAQMAAAMTGADAVQNFAHLPKIQAETLLTWGRDDRVTPLDGALLPLRLIPNAELHVFPKCGHWAMIEQKAAFEAVAKAFLLR